MDGDAIRRWAAGHRAAEQRIIEERRQSGPLSPEQSFVAAMELCALVEITPPDAVRVRETAYVRELWVTLKRGWAAKHG
ncbi:MAG: hypothetical protein AB7O24_09970 [Kofleriaceae bacterium]